MQIIFLNTWNAKVRDAITEFLAAHASDTDIFCLQEAQEEMIGLGERALPDHRKIVKRKQEKDKFSQAIYVRRAIPVLSSGSVFESEAGVGLDVFAHVRSGDRDIYISNFHGLSQPGEKLDDAARLRQSAGLIDFFRDKRGLKIIGGDFNLLPKTESVRTFTENGYRDLIKDYGIATTRNRLAWEKYAGNELYHSDYVFTGPGVEVRNFSVPNIEISDHLPLVLDID